MSAHAGLYGPEAVTDAAGRPQRLINVVVTQPDGTTPAVLYTDRTKTVILSTNAVQTDSDGDLSFYADPGQYVIRWTTAGVTHQKTVEVGVDFADQGGGVAAVSSVNGHTGDVVLVAADVGADAAGAAAAAVTTHVAASDPHGDRAHADAAVATEQTRAQTVEAAKADLVGGLVPIAQIPPAAFDLVQAVATVTDMLALSGGGKGALVRVADDGSGNPALFLLPAGADPTNEANWVEVSMDAEGAAAAALAAAETFATAAAALRVAKAGDTMTGPLVLPGAPTTGLQAATKDYVDAETTRATGAETANATAISAETTRATGVEAGKVAKTGDTMSGDLAMAGRRVTGLADPALAQDAATRAYVLAQIAALVNSAPAILDTLGEIATQLASDESTATALATTVAGKLAIAQNLADLANAGTARTNLGLGSVATHAASEFAPALTRTAVKTGAYTAAAGDLVPVDTATPNANVTVTLPNAPAVGSRVTVKHIAVGAGKSVTIACAGTDVFNKTGGPTSATLTLLNQAIGVQYDTGGIWTVVADDIPKSALDGAYALVQPGYAPTRTTPAQQRRTARRVITNNPGADGWTLVTADASSNVNDTASQMYGAGCATLVTKGDGTQSSLRGLALGAMDLSLWDVEILFKVDDITHLSQSGSVPLLLFLGNSSLAANYQQVLYRVSDGGNTFLSGEWYRLRVTCPTTATTGNPTRTAITDLQLSAWDDNTGNKVTIHVQQVALVPKSSVFPSGVVTVGLDDSWLSQWTNGLPRLAKYGFPATVYPILDTLGDAFHLSLTQLKQLRDLHGFEIGAHAATTADHDAGFDTLSTAALDAELAATKLFMRQNGFISESFAYPLGRFTAATVDAVRHYFSSARTTTHTPVETIPPEDFTRMRGYVVNSGTSLASIQAAIDTAMLQGQWLQLIFHEISDTPLGGSYCSVATYNGIIDYLATRGIPVLTVQDALAAMASEPNNEGATLELLTTGEETVSRLTLNSTIGLGSGTVRLQYFTARKTELVTNVGTMTSTTAAAGLTLAKMGLYAVDDAGNLTLIGATASDTTLFASTGTAYSRALTTPVSKIRGKRYAWAVLVVGTTAPTLPGVNAIGAGPEYAKAPLGAAILGSQADLPASITAASVSTQSNRVYATTTP